LIQGYAAIGPNAEGLYSKDSDPDRPSPGFLTLSEVIPYFELSRLGCLSRSYNQKVWKEEVGRRTLS
jgi:hypothetical protein